VVGWLRPEDLRSRIRAPCPCSRGREIPGPGQGAVLSPVCTLAQKSKSAKTRRGKEDSSPFLPRGAATVTRDSAARTVVRSASRTRAAKRGPRSEAGSGDRGLEANPARARETARVRAEGRELAGPGSPWFSAALGVVRLVSASSAGTGARRRAARKKQENRREKKEKESRAEKKAALGCPRTGGAGVPLVWRWGVLF
jgi:hypothetical protein